MTENTLPPKPRSEIHRPELTFLPRITWGRRLARRLLRGLLRLVVRLLVRVEVHGIENIPARGPAVAVSNHLGDADVIIGLACSPVFFEVMAKVELHDLPVLGWLMNRYGVIWVHRGQPDRRALRAALDGLAEGRILAITPEGRESLTGALEPAHEGAAYLALKSGARVIPVTMTGTENAKIFANLKRLRRSRVTFTAGPPFYLDALPDRQAATRQGTEKIMQALAAQLPPEYRGVYQLTTE